ncbi:MAG TPA: FAD-binding oxidoreductase [Actinomycetota bacterium]
MPGSDVVIVGGGIVGAACAYTLSLAGATVTLFERDELAAGASGRNLGLVDLPRDPVLDPVARRSVALYLEATRDPPSPVHLDREPIGTLAVGIGDEEAAMVREEARAAEGAGIRIERLDAAALREAEPALTPEISEAWLFHEGRRVDPGALTVALATLARSRGAAIRHHLPVRRLLTRGDRVSGVVTDETVTEADSVLLAAGPWSVGLLRPLGIRIPVVGVRGWLVHLSASPIPIHRWIEGAARMLWRREAERVTARDFAAGVAPEPEVGAMIQPSPDGTVVAGTSREPALTWEPFGLDMPRAVTRAAIRLVPGLADAHVLATWSGIRPMSPDERPLVGWLRPGLFVCTGHGSEGVILGGGTAELATALLLGAEPPLDPAPFDPLRFERREPGEG